MRRLIAFLLLFGVPQTSQALDNILVPVCPGSLVAISGIKEVAQRINSPHEAKLNTSSIYIPIPDNIQLDESYQQSGGTMAGGSAGAVANFSQFPRGLHLLAAGMEDGCRGWSVHTPVYSGPRMIHIKAYCHSGSPVSCQRGQNVCNVKVMLCAKIK